VKTENKLCLIYKGNLFEKSSSSQNMVLCRAGF